MQELYSYDNCHCALLDKTFYISDLHPAKKAFPIEAKERKLIKYVDNITIYDTSINIIEEYGANESTLCDKKLTLELNKDYNSIIYITEETTLKTVNIL